MMREGKSSSTRRPVIACILLASAAFLPGPVSAAEATKDEDLKADIIYRCYNLMGEFGVEGVDICVKGELSAMQSVQAVPQQFGEIVRRCTRQVQMTGWEAAKSCVDKEIAGARETKKD